MCALLGILEGLPAPVAIRSILGHEMVLPLPPGKFGGCRVSVVGVYQPWCLRILCRIHGSLSAGILLMGSGVREEVQTWYELDGVSE